MVRSFTCAMISGFLLFTAVGSQVYSQEEKIIISLPTEVLPLMGKENFSSLSSVMTKNDISVVSVNEEELPFISSLMHEKYHRCGGFFVEEDANKALESLSIKNENTVDYSSYYKISHQDLVTPLIEQVQEIYIRDTIQKLSEFKNRYYRSPTGVLSQEKVAEMWKTLTTSRTDSSIEFVEHSSYPQKSVILTLRGQTHPEEVVILGGHGDSISGWMPPPDVRAPGSDDNASGIATITEVIRLIVANGYTFGRTIKFISYAAEEVGLRGSQDIAKKFKDSQINVLGVMQLDMTNFRGSAYDMVFMTDFTDRTLTAYLQNLLHVYLPQVVWSTDSCGYACSDHASWTKAGYPSAIPFESKMADYNQYIHTERDTLDVSGQVATHSVNFAKLALAYIVELGSNL